MKWTASLGAFLLLGCTVPGDDVRVAPVAHSDEQRSFPAVQAFADGVVRDGKVPGIVIAIGIGDEQPRLITAGKTGFESDAGPAGPDSLWRIYSMTKPITGIAAMILVDEGKLKLDQPVSDFFPEFKNGRVLNDPAKGTETHAAPREITVRDLMTHMSGLNYAVILDTPARQELARQGIVPFQLNVADETHTRPLRPKTLREFAQRAGKSALVADPGTKWSYSMGLDVLAAVVEQASGMPFEAFVQQRIFNPLEMTSTYWQVPQSQAGRLVSNYGPSVLVEARWPGTTTPSRDGVALIEAGANSVYLSAPSFPYGGAGLVSSARDYDRFLHMLLNDGSLDGARILSAETARLARSDLLPQGVVLSGYGPVPPGESFGFGAGGFVTVLDRDGFGRGKGTFGWDGAAGTRAWVDPVRKIRATMMINVLASVGVGNDFDKAIASDMAANGL